MGHNHSHSDVRSLDEQKNITGGVHNESQKEIVNVYGGIAGTAKAENVEINLETLTSEEDVKDTRVASLAAHHQPTNNLGLSKARQIALVAILSGASFLNVRSRVS